MSLGAQHCRLAIAAFDAPDRLWRTIQTLLGEGFVLEQICLAAEATTMARAADMSLDAHAVLARPIETWPRRPEAPAGPPIVATSGPLFRLLEHAQSAGDRGTVHARISAQHWSDLAQHMDNGAIVLIVSAACPAQQRISTRTLLNESSRRVQTYEFAMPAGQQRDGEA